MQELTNPHYTHRPFLEAELKKLPKDKNCTILELGVGDGSSLLINNHCSSNLNHKAISFETDALWYNKMKLTYELPNYNFYIINEWSNFSNLFNEPHYDLVFVDQSPWQARIDAIDYLINKTNVFILHDYDYYNNGTLINDQTSFLGQKYLDKFILEDCFNILPPTLIMRKK